MVTAVEGVIERCKKELAAAQAAEAAAGAARLMASSGSGGPGDASYWQFNRPSADGNTGGAQPQAGKKGLPMLATAAHSAIGPSAFAPAFRALPSAASMMPSHPHPWAYPKAAAAGAAAIAALGPPLRPSETATDGDALLPPPPEAEGSVFAPTAEEPAVTHNGDHAPGAADPPAISPAAVAFFLDDQHSLSGDDPRVLIAGALAANPSQLWPQQAAVGRHPSSQNLAAPLLTLGAP